MFLITLLGLATLIFLALVILAAFGKLDFGHEFSFLGYDVSAEMSYRNPADFSIRRK